MALSRPRGQELARGRRMLFILAGNGLGLSCLFCGALSDSCRFQFHRLQKQPFLGSPPHSSFLWQLEKEKPMIWKSERPGVKESCMVVVGVQLRNTANIQNVQEKKKNNKKRCQRVLTCMWNCKSVDSVCRLRASLAHVHCRHH